jgi:dihydroflavonol-4-reductase
MELITGGTGIVGCHLLLELTAAGKRVRALARAGSDRSIVERVFRHYRADAATLLERIEWVEGDLHDMPALQDAMQGVTHVYHAAALVSFDPRDDQALQRTNAGGTANVVDAALISGVQRLCHVSSTAAIGTNPLGMERNEDSPWSATPNTSPYAASKYAAELEVHRGIAEGLDAVIVNPCIILGPGVPGRSTMTLVERIRKGTRFHTAGSNAVVDARDVASCTVRLMREGGSGERYLLVGENLSYKELFATLAKALGRPGTKYAIPPWALSLAWRLERLRTLFGGRPFITRHTAHSATISRSWSNAKARKVLGYTFRPAHDAAANVAAFLQREGA